MSKPNFHNIRKQHIGVQITLFGLSIVFSICPFGRWRKPLFWGKRDRWYKGDTFFHFYFLCFHIWHHRIEDDLFQFSINTKPNNYWWDDLTIPKEIK